MEEIWKDVYGWEGVYQVSNLGRIKRIIKHPKRKLFPYFIKPSMDTDGYHYVILSFSEKREIKKMHRLVAQHFIPNPENKPEVNHKLGIKTDNRATQLEWNTRVEQEQHSLKTGLRQTGDNHFATKIPNAALQDIKNLRAVGNTYQSIADRYNVSATQIYRIANNSVRRAAQ